MNYQPKNGHFYPTFKSVEGVPPIELKNDTAKMVDTINNIDMKEYFTILYRILYKMMWGVIAINPS